MRNFYEQFKTPIVFVILIFLGLGIYTKLFGPIPFYINSTNTTKTDLFSASGEGTATAVPNQATVYAGVTKTAKTVDEAQKQVNSVSEKLIADLKKLGIEKADIKTTNYSVNPSYDNNPRPLMMEEGVTGSSEALFPYQGDATGYEVTQNLEVKVKPIEKVNQVIDTATKDGANLVGGANFTFSDDLQKTLEDQATKEAVKEAKEKAQSLASASGIRLGKVVNVVSSTNNYPYPMALEARKADDSTIPSTNVTPGESTITISVTIYYETY